MLQNVPPPRYAVTCSLLLPQGTPLDEDEARRLFQAMASALAYTSALGLAHHDLKLDNFLLHQVRPPAASESCWQPQLCEDED